MGSVIVVGAGIFGVCAALELRARGYEVTIVDPGPLPHPAASSTDISKAVRHDYGADAFYTDMAEAVFPFWRSANARFGEEVYHPDGFLFLVHEPMAAGGFEFESHALLTARGTELELLDPVTIRERFPAWSSERYAGGYFNRHDGWASSGRVVELLVREARAAGIALREGTSFAQLAMADGRVTGIVTREGEELGASHVVVAAGAWTPVLLPWLADVMWPIGQPVLHFAVDDAAAWRAPVFPTWASDIATTGWYGFPAVGEGRLKIANHGPGIRMRPGTEWELPAEEEARFREFLTASLPALADAPIIDYRVCYYCDTFDGSFWIDRDPDRPGLVVAAGGSGHGFKFAPLYGALVADALEGKPNRWAQRFRWRARGDIAVEGARRS